MTPIFALLGFVVIVAAVMGYGIYAARSKPPVIVPPRKP